MIISSPKPPKINSTKVLPKLSSKLKTHQKFQFHRPTLNIINILSFVRCVLLEAQDRRNAKRSNEIAAEKIKKREGRIFLQIHAHFRDVFV